MQTLNFQTICETTVAGLSEANLYWSSQIVDQVLIVNMHVMCFKQHSFAIMHCTILHTYEGHSQILGHKLL